MHLFPKTHFDFLGKRWAFFVASAILLGGSIASLATRGIRYGIDFTGGTEIRVHFDNPIDLGKLRKAADKAGMPDAALQTYVGTEKPTFSIRIQSDIKTSAEKVDQLLNALAAQIPDNKMTIDSKDYVGPAVGRHLFQQALWAIILSLTGIIVYLGFRFANPVWGVAGIIALFHDVLATYGLFSILGAEVDLLIISAILTIGGYSIHDTIVIFDRMREKMRHMRRESLAQVMNESMNETLSRTVITSMTVLAVVTILYLFGGQVIHHFAMAMVFGTIVGTYSSIAVAAPFVYEWSLRSGSARPADTKPQAVTKPKPAGRS
jgi:preprotein translocase subunit SecF